MIRLKFFLLLFALFSHHVYSSDLRQGYSLLNPTQNTGMRRPHWKKKYIGGQYKTVFGEESSLGIDHAEEMELLLENYYMQAEEMGNKTRELKGLIDDSESVIFINLDSHRNVMMRLNLQLTMGSFSLSLFGLIGVAFGMNLTSCFEEDPRVFWLVTGFMFLGSGLIWRRLLSFLGRHLEPSTPPLIPPVWKRNLKPSDVKTGVR